MKKFILAIILLLPFFASAQTSKVGVVDTNAIIQAMPETKAAEAQISETSKKYEEEFGKLQQEFNRLYESFQTMPETTPKAVRDHRTRELALMNETIEAFTNDSEQDLKRLQKELMAPIVEKVRIAIDLVGKEAGYTVIMDSNNLLYFSSSDDLTPTVKQRLGL